MMLNKLMKIFDGDDEDESEEDVMMWALSILNQLLKCIEKCIKKQQGDSIDDEHWAVGKNAMGK